MDNVKELVAYLNKFGNQLLEGDFSTEELAQELIKVGYRRTPSELDEGKIYRILQEHRSGIEGSLKNKGSSRRAAFDLISHLWRELSKAICSAYRLGELNG